MDLFYFFIGGLVIIIFILRSELLIERQSFILVLWVSIASFLAGVALHFTEVGRYSMSGALLCPLVTLGLFQLCRKVFLRLFKHEPRDTLFNWSSGLGEDRVFNIVYFALAGGLWMLIPFGVEQLSKAGW